MKRLVLAVALSLMLIGGGQVANAASTPRPAPAAPQVSPGYTWYWECYYIPYYGPDCYLYIVY